MVQVWRGIVATDALRRALYARVAQQVAALIDSVARGPGIGARVVEENAPPNAARVRHKADRLRRRPVRDQRAAHVQVIVAVKAHHCPGLDGQGVTRGNAHVAVDDIRLVARPGLVGGDRAAKRIVGAACGDGERDGGRVRAAVGCHCQCKGNRVVIARAAGDVERIDRAARSRPAGGDIAVESRVARQRHVGVGGAQDTAHARRVGPGVAQRHGQRRRLPRRGAAKRVAVYACPGQCQDRAWRLHRGGGVDAPRAEFPRVGRIERVNVICRLLKLVAHQRRGPVGPMAAHERRQPGDERRGEGRAVGGAPVAAQEGRSNHRCWRAQVHPGAVVRVPPPGIVWQRAGHRQCIRVSGRVERRGDVVVARAAHDHRASSGGIIHRLAQQVGVGITAQAQVDDLRPLVGGVAHAQRNVRVVGGAGIGHHAHRHNAAVPAHTGDAHAVVRGCCRDACHLCAVTVAIGDIAGIPNKVPAVYVVHIAVTIVIQAVARDLAGVDPQSVGQVGVGQVNARVNDGNHDRLRPGHHIPGGRGLDFAQAPLLRKERVIGNSGDGEGEIVRLGPLDSRIGGEDGDESGNIAARSQVEAVGAVKAENQRVSHPLRIYRHGQQAVERDAAGA